MLDFSATRVDRQRTDPSRVISSIQNAGNSVAQSELAGAGALAQGIQQGLGGIAQGIREKNDPATAARKAAAAAALKDNQQQTEAEALRGGSKVQTAAELVAQQNGGLAVESRGVAAHVTKNVLGVDFDELPAVTQQSIVSLVDTHAQRQYRTHSGGADAGRTLGQHGAYENIGGTADENLKLAAQALDADVRRLSSTDPRVAATIQRKALTQTAVSDLTAVGRTGAAAIVKQEGFDPETAQKAGVFDQVFTNNARTMWALPDGSVAAMTAAEAFAAGVAESPSALSANKASTRQAVPSLGVVRGANGKPIYHPEVDDDVLRPFDPKTAEGKLMQGYAGKSTEAAAQALATFRFARSVGDNVVSGKRALKDGASEAARNAHYALNGLHELRSAGKLTADQLAALVATQNGETGLRAEDLASGETLLDPTVLTQAADLLRQAAADPEMASRLLVARGGEATKKYAEQMQGMVTRGQFAGAAGPLSGLEAAGFTDRDIARYARTYLDAEAAQPEYRHFRGLLAGVPGISGEHAERLTRAHFPAMTEQLHERRAAARFGDRTYAQLTPQEQMAADIGFAKKIADEVAGVASEAATARASMAKEAGRADLAADAQGAQALVDAAAQAGEKRGPEQAGADRPETFENAVSRATTYRQKIPGGHIDVENGRAVGVTAGGKSVVFRQNLADGETTELWKVATRMATETTPIETWGGELARASVIAESPVVRDLIDGAFAGKLYGMLQAPSDKDGPAVKAHIEKWMASKGLTAIKVRDALNREYGATGNAFVGMLAGFVGGVLSPSRTTNEHLNAIEGVAPTRIQLQRAADAEQPPASGLMEGVLKDAMQPPPASSAQPPLDLGQRLQQFAERGESPASKALGVDLQPNQVPWWQDLNADYGRADRGRSATRPTGGVSQFGESAKYPPGGGPR